LDGHPVGYVKLASSQPPEGLPAGADMEIVRIYSEQHTIGKGVGRALMQASIHQAREQGKPWIWLGVWEHNQRAIDFYRKWGFEKFGEHVFMVGEDPQTDWWMKKKV
jgi:ribosomal protein S18 acetylase RimI-like enzyme